MLHADSRETHRLWRDQPSLDVDRLRPRVHGAPARPGLAPVGYPSRAATNGPYQVRSVGNSRDPRGWVCPARPSVASSIPSVRRLEAGPGRAVGRRRDAVSRLGLDGTMRPAISGTSATNGRRTDAQTDRRTLENSTSRSRPHSGPGPRPADTTDSSTLTARHGKLADKHSSRDLH